MFYLGKQNLGTLSQGFASHDYRKRGVLYTSAKELLCLFNIGDKVVYPMHGAGVIEGIEEMDVDGCSQTYYVMLIAMGNLRIKIAASKATDAGLRSVYSKDEVLECVRTAKCIGNGNVSNTGNWNQRYKDNLDRIRSGNLDEVASVFRSLLQRDQEKGLSSVEKKMMQNVRQIIISELVVAQNIKGCEAEKILEETVLGQS